MRHRSILTACLNPISTPHDVLAILDDFNAITGVPTTGSNVVGPYGNGSRNDNRPSDHAV